MKMKQTECSETSAYKMRTPRNYPEESIQYSEHRESLKSRSHEVCCLYGCFVYHILSYYFGSFFYHCIYGCMFCIFLFNFVNYVLLLLRLCILTGMYVLFRVLCLIVSFCVLYLCKSVLYYCHRVSTQLQLSNISIRLGLF
jgi:hypothetical protein